jgi:hypothetical protein
MVVSEGWRVNKIGEYIYPGEIMDRFINPWTKGKMSLKN